MSSGPIFISCLIYSLFVQGLGSLRGKFVRNSWSASEDMSVNEGIVIVHRCAEYMLGF